MIELILTPLLVSILLAILCGPLGCFIVWRKMAYFGDTIAHSSLLGVALGIFLQINLTFSVVLMCAALSIFLSLMHFRHIAIDSLLGIFAHGSLAVGLLVLSLLSDSRINIQSILFGDLLSISNSDLISVLVILITFLGLIIVQWKRLLVSTIDYDIAKVEGFNPDLTNFLLTIVVAITIAFCLQIVGALLISGLLIIPAATARSLSKSPEAMAVFATLLGIISVCGGILASVTLDTPTGPSIVSVCLLLFICSQIRQAINTQRN